MKCKTVTVSDAVRSARGVRLRILPKRALAKILELDISLIDKLKRLAPLNGLTFEFYFTINSLFRN